MSVIWKTVLERKHVQDIDIPAYAEFISTGLDPRSPESGLACIWYKCRPANEPIRRRIVICYTGDEGVPEDEGNFIGTVIKPSGIVLHIFEVIIPRDERFPQ